MAAIKPIVRASLLISIFLAIGAIDARAGISLKQEVEIKTSGKNFKTENEWLIQNDKFKLTTKSATAITQYLFTGTLFYICGRLNDQQISLLKAKMVSTEVLENLKKGTCQVVPSNFMVRFFLSPITSVESVDASDGLKLTLALSQYQTKKGAAKPNAKKNGLACEPLQRSFDLQKVKTDTGGADTRVHVKVAENLCIGSAVPWRTGLWREVTKAVLRQPGGASLMSLLRRDHTEISGLPLSGSIEQEITLVGQPSQKMVINVLTTDQKSIEISPAMFRLPAGIKVFNPEAVSTLAASPSPASTNQPGGAQPSQGANGTSKPLDRQNFVDFLQSTVFCALARGICIQ